MSVISTYTATVTISVFITIIVLTSNTSNGQHQQRQHHEQNFYTDRLTSSRRSNSREISSGSSLVYPKDHIPDGHDTNYDSSYEQSTNDEENSIIPLELIQQIDVVSNISEFFDKFVDKESIDPQNGIANGFGTSSLERSVGLKPPVANCLPSDAVVPLHPIDENNDPQFQYYPKCTRIKQCSGCCNSPVLICEPTKTEERIYTVYKISNSSKKNKVKIVENVPVSVDEHIACACNCRVKPEHCRPYQIYNSQSCNCICRNKDERTKCESTPGKLWDPSSCSCSCRNEHACTSGTLFNSQTCKCEEDRGNKPRFGTAISREDRNRLIIKAIPYEPDNSTIYDTE